MSSTMASLASGARPFLPSVPVPPGPQGRAPDQLLELDWAFAERFIGGLAHNVNNLLTGIVIAIEVANEHLAHRELEKAHSALQLGQRCNARLVELIGHLAGLAEPATSPADTRLEPIELRGLVLEAIRHTAGPHDQGRVEPGGPVTVRGFATALARALEELAAARQQAVAEQGQVVWIVERDRSCAVITVEDEGCQLDPRPARRQDALAASDPEEIRHGLGLFILLATVRWHRGTLRTGPGRRFPAGNRIEIRLPLAPEPVPLDPPLPEALALA